ncbi:MAG: hypothetical protein NVS1B13_02630 [Flavisolibacter sp.]
MRHIVIIGNGIAGITCARNIRKLGNDFITVISSETEHFFSRTALMYIYMGHMKYEHTKPYEDFFWAKNRIELVYNHVLSIDAKGRLLYLKNEGTISFDILIIATGSVTQKFNWPGQNLIGVQGLYSYQDLQSMDLETRNVGHAVIAGGGLIGAEMAEMLHSRNIKVTLLVKDDRYWASVLPGPDANLVARQIQKNGIGLIYNSEIKEIIGDENGRVKNLLTTKGENIDCQFIGIATGVKPNIALTMGSDLKTERGILVNEYFETNCNNIYAIGDCAQFTSAIEGRKNIEQVWYTGRMHGETLALSLCKQRTPYKPGPWFNSAKFFDLEYQTYGLVSAKLNQNEAYFFWQHPKKDLGFGAVYYKDSKFLKGVNSYGIRLRHQFFDKCLKEKRTVEEVLSRLDQALFDPEFARNHVAAIIADYNQKMGATVKRVKSRFGFLYNEKSIS